MSTLRDPARCRVVVCRGCCCGTISKHPDADHDGQVARLAALPAGLTVTGCLGQCDTSNNIVVIPSPAGRQHGGTVTWFGHMLSPALTDAVAQWIDAGGPGIAAIPDVLAAQQIPPPGRPTVQAALSQPGAARQG